MKSYRFGWQPRLLSAALLATFLLSASLVGGQAVVPPKKADEKPLPSKKTVDEDPPLPSKKPVPAKQVRVQVIAASAEVQAADKVIATVSRGQVLPFTKKNKDYYLVIVDGKKGWIKREEVREVEVAVDGKGEPAIELPPGPAPAVIAAETTRKVKQATVHLRVRLANGTTVEGSGFFAVQPGLVLTNAHVLGMLSPGSPTSADVGVVVHSGEPEEFTLSGEILGVDRENDLGVVRVKGKPGRLPAPLAVGTSRTLALVQKVYIFGFPFGTSLGKNITVSESSISSIRKDAAGSATQVQVNGGMHPGNSGGPVVDSRGVVVGVAVSIIRGTQINFAVPGERVQELLRGRVAQTEFDEAFLDKRQVKLPVRLNCVDPLQRIRTLKLEVWVGNATPPRPPALLQPKPLPDDGPRQSIVVTYRNGRAQADVPIPTLTDGQVLWVQPALTDNGSATCWARAVAYKPSELPPLEREAVVLEQRDHQRQRTIKLSGSFRTQLSKGPLQLLLHDFMELEGLEAVQKEPRGRRIDLFLGAYKFTTTEKSGKPQPLFPQAQGFLRGRNMTYIVDLQGALQQRTVPVLNPRLPLVLREDYHELVHLLANSYEMTCLPVLNRRVQARETWQARVPLILATQGKKQIVDMFLTCTYEGSRVHGGQRYAVIGLSGRVLGRAPGPQAAAGILTGKVHFAIEDGYVSLAQLKVASESGNGEMTVAHTVEVSLTRVRGNTAGIIATPVGPVPAAPLVKGKLIVQSVLALAANDAVDCPGKQGCFYKIQSLKLVAGKTYVIEMDKLGQSNLDPYLVLVNPGGQVVARDDDGGGFPNARIVYKPQETGMFRVYATALVPRMMGAFRLTVAEEASPTSGSVSADHALAIPFLRKRDFDQAIPHLEKAVAANPSHVGALIDLAFAYNEKRLHDKAIPCLKKIIELDPNHARAHNNLGFAYNGMGLYDQAIPSLQKAIEIDPNYAVAHNNLGFAYNTKGLSERAISSLKKAVEFQPKQATPCDNLAAALGEAGELKQARDALTKLLTLIPQDNARFRTAKKSLEQMEALLGLEPRLPDIAKGTLTPKGFEQGLQFGKLCRLKQHYRAALRLYEEALASDPQAAKKLAPINLLVLARTALLASAGSGSDVLPEAERPKYRAKALDWLRRYLKTQQEALEKKAAVERHAYQKNIRVLRQHEDLASVRRPALDDLPARERREWERFWTELDTLCPN